MSGASACQKSSNAKGPLSFVLVSEFKAAGVQETDRGRHDKKTLKERSLYSVDTDMELASCQNPN